MTQNNLSTGHPAGVRNDAAAVRQLALLTEERRREASRAGTAEDRLTRGCHLLAELLDKGDGRAGVETALHRPDGVLDERLAAEYLRLIAGSPAQRGVAAVPGIEGRTALQAIIDRRHEADITRGHGTASRLYALAEQLENPETGQGQSEQQAVTGQVVHGAPGVPNPRQGAIAPGRPARPDDTAQMVAVQRERGIPISVAQERAMRMDGQAGMGEVAGPDFGPSPDQRFTTAALPMGRHATTQQLPPVETESDEDREDGGDGETAEPRPFTETDSTEAAAAGAARAGAGRAGGDDMAKASAGRAGGDDAAARSD